MMIDSYTDYYLARENIFKFTFKAKCSLNYYNMTVESTHMHCMFDRFVAFCIVVFYPTNCIVSVQSVT
jgi:hypothetical protein